MYIVQDEFLFFFLIFFYQFYTPDTDFDTETQAIAWYRV